MSAAIVDSIRRILGEHDEPDDALRTVVSALAAADDIEWAGIAFFEEGSLTLGPADGVPNESLRERIPILFQDTTVGELWVDGHAPRGPLEQIATLVAGHVLIGWDTRGEAWDP